MGFQFENLVLANTSAIHEFLSIPSTEIICHGPYFQTETRTRKSCQIDYLIQTRYNIIYVGEIKFKDGIISSSIIPEVQEKINRLERPNGFSCRPVLIHVNGVAQSVVDSGFFSAIIDFGDFLKKEG